MISVRDAVALFCDNASVCLFEQMVVGFLGKRKIVFFTHHQTFGFVGQDVVISIPADTDNRFGAEISLLKCAVRISLKVIRKLMDQIFAFNFHGKVLLIRSLTV